MTWPHMSFKPTKSRSLVLKRGKITDQFCFRLGEDQIPSVPQSNQWLALGRSSTAVWKTDSIRPLEPTWRASQQCPPQPIRPVHVGQSRNTCMPPVFQDTDPCTFWAAAPRHWARVLSLETQPGPPDHRWGNEQGDQWQQICPCYSQNNHVR